MMTNLRKLITILGLACGIYFVNAEKKILTHDDFDAWQKVTNHAVSNDGNWTSFSVQPQEGDGILTFYSVKNGKKIEIERGYKPQFSADSKWAFALIKPFFSITRQAKIDKKTGFDLPQDSLAIIDLTTGKIEKQGDVISYQIGKEGGEWIAWLSCDTTYVSQDVLKDKKAGRPLMVRNFKNGTSKTINGVSDYLFSEDGRNLAVTLTKQKKDSLATDGIGIMVLPDTAFHLIDRDKKFYGAKAFDRKGERLAYIASEDSTETGTRICNLFLCDLSGDIYSSKELPVSVGSKSQKHLMKPHSDDPETQAKLEKQWAENMKKGSLFINQYSSPEFSYNSRRLVVGVAPYIAPDDTTLVDFEKASLDIWRWDAPYTPPQELSMLDELQKKTFPVVIDLESGSRTLMTDNPLVTVSAPDRWDADWALIEDPSENIISLQWDYQFPIDLSIKNVLNGEEKSIGIAKNELYELSPAGKYVVWFDNHQYYCYDISTGITRCISEMVPFPLWTEDQDVPLKEREPYGDMGWTDNDGAFLVYDRYDVWMLDPRGEKQPICLTDGEGRERGLKIRYVKTNPEERAISDKEALLFSLYSYSTKEYGMATSRFEPTAKKPKIDFLGNSSFWQVRGAKNKDVYSWVQGNFETSPNIYVASDIEKGKIERVSDSNPQMKDYRWGTAQLFKWYAYDGTPAEGVLYLPDDFDAEKSYPMIAYFYERESENLYRHYDMEPSWSWINFPFYVSRGYVVFVPDIYYTTGIPGENAYNFVCSGVEEVCRKFPNIDKSRIGIDGQSWGGYQTAYLVTRTNMFACAGSGAPVANMTSAFGGIRWGSGDSRQAQYEVGQSRIGRNLWEAPELYITNSPIFYADRVNTPLLIMHNDADGAVPWYQGIEMFMALRRLGKPVWMLQYNSESHNLKERRNRKDITIRLQQFFDHYLKGDPMPEWMKNGIPAVRKGQEYGY